MDELAAAFRPVPLLPELVAGCTYCFSPQDELALRVEPQEVTASALAQFLWHPPDHYDAYSELLRRFFPPAAAALAHDLLHVDAGLVLHRLPEAGWTAWPQRAQTAVHAYLVALLTDVLVQPPPAQEGLTAEEVLSGAASATGSTREWLGLWDSVVSPWKADHVQALALFHASELLQGPDVPLLGWWPEAANAELASWLLSNPVVTVLRAGGTDEKRQATLALLTDLATIYDRW